MNYSPGILIYGWGHLAETLCRAADLRGMTRVSDADRADLLFVAVDVLDHQADLGPVWADFCLALEQRRSEDDPIVVLSQVPPGWTRESAAEHPNIFYQADTIIMRRAVERMAHPEQFIIGCAEPGDPLPLAYQEYLAAHGPCPVLQMSYESAELAKCMINVALMKQIELANLGEAAAEILDADWGDVAAALRNDVRIGPHAYLRPGMTNQHLDRDVQTVDRIIRGTEWE